MSVDTELFLAPRWQVQDIQETIESLYEISVKVHSTTSPGYVTLLFTLEGKGRSLSVHSNYNVAGFMGTLITLNADEQGQRVIKDLAERLGGWYTPNDCEDAWERYENVSDHNLGFLLKEFVKQGGDGRNGDAFAKYVKNWNAKVKVI